MVAPLALAIVGGSVALSTAASANPHRSATTSVSASPAPASCPTTYARAVDVSNADQLTAALANAKAGDQIRMADGTYAGMFVSATPGTAQAPVVICGSSAAVIDSGDPDVGYAFYVQNAPYTSIYGVTVTDAQKGIVLDASPHAVIDGVTVHNTGDEAVHFRRATSDSVISNSWIYDTGRLVAKYGEGVYVGSAKSNWCTYTDCNPDQSDRVSVLNNRIGPGVTAEEVDVKEGTTGGLVQGNTLDGSGMVAVTGGATSWVDVKGNNWQVTRNTGLFSLRHGFTDSLAATGWGNNNVFSANTAFVNASGYGVSVVTGVTGVQVMTNNVVYGAASGVSNIPLTTV